MASTGDGWNRDTLIGIAGAAILVAAMAGVFLYERGQFHEYGIDWQMQEAGTAGDQGSANTGDSSDHAFTLGEGDLPENRALARVRATVTWSDGVGQPDTFSVEVTGPGDLSGDPQSDDSGSVTAEAQVADEPAQTTASGRTAQDAQDQAASSLDSGPGLGEWTVTVTLEDAPGEADDGNPATMEQADGSNDYDVRLAWDVWEPVVSG